MYGNNVSISPESFQGDRMIECMVEGGHKAVKKETIFNCFAFFCMFLNTLSCMVP
jgi:hypothetical protein